MSIRLPLLTTLVLSLAAGSALAQQDVRVYRADEAVNPQDVADILDTTPAPAMKMRSIRLLDDPPANDGNPLQRVSATAGELRQAPAAHPASHPAPRNASLSLPVQFSFDSADILPAARRQLDALAQGIRLLPGLQKVVIEGHTDATGSDRYNEQLSLKRAYAVMNYLVSQQGIDASRLRAVGLGKSAPLPERSPSAPENRRVQFHGE